MTSTSTGKLNTLMITLIQISGVCPCQPAASCESRASLPGVLPLVTVPARSSEIKTGAGSAADAEKTLDLLSLEVRTRRDSGSSARRGRVRNARGERRAVRLLTEGRRERSAARGADARYATWRDRRQAVAVRSAPSLCAAR